MRTVSDTVPFADLQGMHAPLADELIAAFSEALAGSAFIGGEPVARFEQEWARYCGRDHAIGVANGTDAIELVLRALGIGPGDEVVLPTNTFIATAEAVVATGATPVFADVEARTLLLSAATVEPLITTRTRAVIVVHLFGHLPDMAALAELAGLHGLHVVEDAAQAHGALWRLRPAGSFGVAGCFSFYPGKNLGALGDGGAIVTDDAALAAAIRSLADHGRSDGSKYLHDVVGRNSRLDAVQAAMLSVKLPALDGWNAGRRDAAESYRPRLQALGIPLVDHLPDVRSAWHLLPVLVEDRDRVRADLLEVGVETGVHYPVPCHLQRGYRRWAHQHLPVAQRAAGHLLSLPLFPTMTPAQVDRVCDALHAVGAKEPMPYDR